MTNHYESLPIFYIHEECRHRRMLPTTTDFSKIWFLCIDYYEEFLKSEFNNPEEHTYDCIERFIEFKSTHLPSITIEFGDVVYEFNPCEPDEWQSDGDYDYHYDYGDGVVCVYKVVNGETNTAETIHKQTIEK